MKSYNSWPVADSARQEVRARLKQLELFDQLKAQGFSTALCRLGVTYKKTLSHLKASKEGRRALRSRIKALID